MRRIFLLLLSLLLVLVVSGSAGALQVAEVDRPDIQGFMGFVPDEIVVQFAPGILKKMNKATAPQGRLGLPDLDHLGAKHGVLSIKPQFPGAQKKMYRVREVDLAGWHQVKFRGEVDVMAVVKAYKAVPGVLNAQPIGIHTVSLCPDDEGFDNSGNTQNVDQWHLKKIQVCEAFDYETGNENIIVAIPDTGVRYFHKDLGGAEAFYKANTDPNQNPFTPAERALMDGNVWFNLAEKTGSDSIDNDFNGKIDDWVGWDFVSTASTFPYPPYPGEDGSVEDNDPRDFNGHGTHCAGIVAAITNNVRDLASVAGGWGESASAGNGVKIMPLRIGWSADYYGIGFWEVGMVRMDYAANAMYYAAQKGAKIVSCSWGSSNSGGLASAVDYFLGTGGLVFKAAGNSNNQTADYLCSRPDVISVAATDQNDYKASFSSYGTWVDISAPGVDIWSLYHIHEGLEPYGLYPWVDYVEKMSGTSMASPLAAGVAALIWSQNPSWTAAQVKQKLFDSADNIDALNPTYAGKLGAGRVNAHEAVRSGEPANTAPTVTITSPANDSTFPEGTEVTFTGTADDAEEGDISSAIGWTSSRDGSLGIGGSITTDTLSPGTHTITAAVTDSGALPGSDEITITIEPPTTTTMHVGDLDNLSTSLNKRFWQAIVTVTVHDDNHAPVATASVYGTFSNVKRNGSVTGVTDGNGQVSFSKNFSNKTGSTTFTVTDVTYDALEYQEGANHDPDGDSNGTSIILQP